MAGARPSSARAAATIRFTRAAVSGWVRAICALTVIQETVGFPCGTEGASMMPTISNEGDKVLRINLGMYRLIAPFLPARVAPAFHQLPSEQRHSPSAAHIGGQRGKLDPAMGTGLAVGDLIVFQTRHRVNVEACKRIIGLAGDTVLVDPRIEPSDRHALLWQRDQRRGTTDSLEHAHVSAAHQGEPRYVVVPPGHVWVTGDNLANSTDSREYGPVPLGMVRGRIIARVWPLGHRGWLANTMERI